MEEQVKGSIRVFLVNWGMLSRVPETNEKGMFDFLNN